MAFILVLITNTKIAKTVTSFLALETLGGCLDNNLFYCSSSK